MIIFVILLIAAVLCAVKMSIWDWRTRIIPDIYLFPFLLTGLAVSTFFPWFVDIGESVVAAAFGYGLGIMMSFIFTKIRFKNPKSQISNPKSPIGMGDIKLLAAGGVWLGFTGLAVALIVSCMLGGLWGLRKKQKFVPFAPFFFIGAVVAVVFLIVF